MLLTKPLCSLSRFATPSRRRRCLRIRLPSRHERVCKVSASLHGSVYPAVLNRRERRREPARARVSRARAAGILSLLALLVQKYRN